MCFDLNTEKQFILFVMFLTREVPYPTPRQIRKSRTLKTDPGAQENNPQPLTSWPNVLNQRRGVLHLALEGEP